MDSNDEWLQQWREADRVTLQTSKNPLAKLLIEACNSGDGVEIIYFGGSTPGGYRVIYPRRLFKVRGYNSIYVEAYCETRGADRTFRLDKIQLANLAHIQNWIQPQRPITTTPTQVNSRSSSGCLTYVVVGILSMLLLIAIAFGGLGK